MNCFQAGHRGPGGRNRRKQAEDVTGTLLSPEEERVESDSTFQLCHLEQVTQLPDWQQCPLQSGGGNNCLVGLLSGWDKAGIKRPLTSKSSLPNSSPLQSERWAVAVSII